MRFVGNTGQRWMVHAERKAMRVYVQCEAISENTIDG